jgi:hypothetical protein
MTQTAYLHRVVIVAPAAMADLSADIAGAIGPGEGDRDSFLSIRATRGGVEHQVCDASITVETHAGYVAMQSNPAVLHGAVVAGWTRKGLPGVPPTATECAAWLADSTIWLGPAAFLSGVSVDDILAGLGYERVIEQVPLGQ